MLYIYIYVYIYIYICYIYMLYMLNTADEFDARENVN